MDYFNKIKKEIDKFKNLGSKKLDNGTLLIGHVPHLAPQAYIHSIFAPLKTDDLKILEKQLKMPIPQVYQEFLKKCNGLHLFLTTLTLDGLRFNNIRNSEENYQPFHLDLPNVKERIKDSKQNYFFIGGYDWDGSLLYIDTFTDKIFRCSQDSSEPLNEWPNFETMLLSEVKRLLKLFNDDGSEIKSDTPTIPF